MRIRTIKPEFWSDEDLVTVSDKAKLLAIALLNYADDEGYFRANPKLIRAALFPLSPSVKTTVLLRELSNIGYIELCTGTDGKKYGRLPTFTIHQVINKPKDSKVRGLWGVPDEYRTNTVSVPPGTGNREQGKEGNREPERGAVELPYGPAFGKAWEEWIVYRQHGKYKKLQAASLQKQLDRMTAFNDENRAIAMIENTIEKGYRGLYEANETNRGNLKQHEFEKVKSEYPEGKEYNLDA